MGCTVAVEVAKQRPDLVRRLVLFGPPFYAAAPSHTKPKLLAFFENAYFTLFAFLKENPDFTIAGAETIRKTLPTIKGMEITKQTWGPFKDSLNHTIMQFETYKDVIALQTPTLLVGGLFDFFIIRKNLKDITRQNPSFVKLKTTFGRHEITPRQGKLVANILKKLNKIPKTN